VKDDNSETENQESHIDLSQYAGYWVAVAEDQIAGVGNTAAAAARLGRRNRMREPLTVYYVDPAGGEPITLPPLLSKLYKVFAWQDQPVYLVGGVVRDVLLGRPIHDFDFVVEQRAIRLAFRVANSLGEPAYVLDKERDSGRVVLQTEKTTLDFAKYRASDLEADLRERDFTINAMALPAGAKSTASLIDPCDGQSDLSRGVIRQTHRTAISDDPVRTLRAIRLGLELGFNLSPGTADAVTEAATMLEQVSNERIRDEFLKLMRLDSPDLAIEKLNGSGLLEPLLPQVAALGEVVQTEPHHEHALAHTIRVLRWLVALETTLQGKAAGGQPILALVLETLAPYFERLREYFERETGGGLDGYSLLRLGALFHDVGKTRTMTIDPAGGRIRFIGHEKVGAELTEQSLRHLRMSNEAVGHVGNVVLGHMRPLFLARNPSLSKRAIHRYFRSTGQAGLDICLVALADQLAISDVPGGIAPAEGTLESLLGVVAQLYAHYWDRYDEVIKPAPLVSGHDLMDFLQLPAGPEVGRLLLLIEEAQAAGEIATHQEALLLADRSLRSHEE
jgi:putative nucleotidyltransferase with HDIG domain